MPKSLLCHVVISLPSFHSCRSFFENAHLLAMIAHFMKLLKSAVERITPSQIPAIAVDQPLILLAEQTQWTLREMHNEDQYVTMLGGLYIEMTALKCLGWYTRFATLLSSAYKPISFQRSQLFSCISRSTKADFTIVLWAGSYQLRQIALCTSTRHVRASMQASRCAHIQNFAAVRL